MNQEQNELPNDNFGELAIELRRVAREQAEVVVRLEEVVARLEAGVSGQLGEATRFEGMRFVLAAQRQRAEMAGSLCRVFETLIPLEREVRALHAAMSSRTAEGKGS